MLRQSNPLLFGLFDHNQNSQIETRDILNLGGNRADSANTNTNTNTNTSAEAALADADAVMQRGEGQSLAALHITAINFKTGEVSYADGHRDALTAQTLQAETNGVKQSEGRAECYIVDSCSCKLHAGYGPILLRSANDFEWRLAA